MKLMYLHHLWFTCALLFSAAACSSDKSKHIPDVSDIPVDWSLIRFEKELLSLDSANGLVNTEPVFEKYPAFSDLYFREILGFRGSPDSVQNAAGRLLAEPGYRKWLDTCSSVFSNFEKYREELDRSFRFLRYYFPEKKAPDVYTLVSEFSIGNFIFQDQNGAEAIGIGLDFFLGPKFPYPLMAREFPAFSQYLSRSFTPEHMTRKSMAVIVEDLSPSLPPANLLEAMIHEGKKMYVLEKLVPFAEDSVLWEFTPRQFEWVQQNEGAIWRHFIKDELLYSTDRTLIQKLTLASPNSPGMPLEAPGRAAVFTGYKIIEQLHRREPELSLQDLLNLRDAQDILSRARYKPR